MGIKQGIRIVAVIEILIGVTTIFGLTLYTMLSMSAKPMNVAVFVFISAVISATIGVGLYNYKHWGRTLILFFSGYVLITKIMVFFGLLHFNGEIITFMSTDIKNWISIIYHFAVMVFFSTRSVKAYFAEAA